MIGIHVRDNVRLGFEQCFRAGKISQKIFRREINNAAEPCDQMNAVRPDPEK